MTTSIPAFVLLLLLTLLHVTYCFNRTEKLKDCACREGIPVYLRSSPVYSRLKSQLFRSDFAVLYAISKAHAESHVSVLVKCARQAQIRVCARFGGYSYNKRNLCEGLLIDLSSMNAVRMQPGEVAYIQPGATLDEVLWNVHKEKRWLAAGLCPSEGFAGYFFGKGHGPDEGGLGMACDNMLSLRMVDQNGHAIFVSKSKTAELFWAFCKAGGESFGIITVFRWKTVSSRPFDKAVVF